MFTFIWKDSQCETHELCRDCISIPRALYLINFDVSGYITELIQGQEALKHEVLELKKKIEILQLQVDYQPGGRGAKEAKRSFESLKPFLKLKRLKRINKLIEYSIYSLINTK